MKNRSRIKIKGLNQEKILNKLSKQVKIYNFQKDENNCSQFEVDYKDKKITNKILAESNAQILSINEKGFLHKFKKIFFSTGILLGLIVGSLIYTLQYFFIWRVDVYGIENKDEIVDFINKSIGSRLKNKIDIEKIEGQVRENFDMVSSISMAIIGQSLVVNINKNVLPEEMNNDFQPIKSEFNGEITHIKLTQGTINCKVGDIVKEGDILVYPYVIDSQGEKRDVNPKAEIMADVWISETTIHYDYYLKKERTGKKTVNLQVILGDKVIYENNKEVKFDEYDVEEKTQMLTKNLFLPFVLRQTIYYETVTFEVSQPFEEVKGEIIENTRLKALQFLGKNEIIKKEMNLVKQGYNFNQVTYIITVNRNIGG